MVGTVCDLVIDPAKRSRQFCRQAEVIRRTEVAAKTTPLFLYLPNVDLGKQPLIAEEYFDTP
ncbi:hypothetical protein N184_31015 [Sinorhizobium sp. GL28]|nr:hypothetical protein N184_31015 [Sinorhizobium sp. GL28]